MIATISHTLVKATAEGVVLRTTFNNGTKGWLSVNSDGRMSAERTRKEAETALSHRASLTR
jgi:hypothetical protein